MNIIFWQSIVSPHQVPFLKWLPVLRTKYRFVIVVPEVMQATRLDIGWREEKLDGYELIIAPTEEKVDELITTENSIHVIEGIRGFSLGWKVIQKISGLSTICIMSEAPDLRGKIRGGVRRLATVYIERRFRHKISGVFYIGSQARSWYEWNGYSSKILFPHHYVVENRNWKDVDKINYYETDLVHFIFVGSLRSLKGVDRLLKAISKASNRDKIRLSLVGDGPERNNLELLTNKLGLNTQVLFLGVQSNSVARELINKSDYLVLPSYYDGWGAVVNEALMDGVPVIVSTSCGSADLINRLSSIGFSFDFDEELVEVIDDAFNQRTVYRSRKKEIADKASLHISGEAVAKKFLKSIDSLNL